MAAEFAHIFHAFGARVTILARSGFLKEIDEKLRKQALRNSKGLRSARMPVSSGLRGNCVPRPPWWAGRLRAGDSR